LEVGAAGNDGGFDDGMFIESRLTFTVFAVTSCSGYWAVPSMKPRLVPLLCFFLACCFFSSTTFALSLGSWWRSSKQATTNKASVATNGYEERRMKDSDSSRSRSTPNYTPVVPFESYSVSEAPQSMAATAFGAPSQDWLNKRLDDSVPSAHTACW